MDCYLSDDPSYRIRIHTSESNGASGESWAAVNAIQSMVPVEPVVESKIRMTLLPSLFIEPEPAVKTKILSYAQLMINMSQMPSPCKHIKAKVSKLHAMLMFFHCVERKKCFIVFICSKYIIA